MAFIGLELLYMFFGTSIVFIISFFIIFFIKAVSKYIENGLEKLVIKKEN